MDSYLNAVIDNKNIIVKVYESENERILDKAEMVTNGATVYRAQLVNGGLIIRKSK